MRFSKRFQKNWGAIWHSWWDGEESKAYDSDQLWSWLSCGRISSQWLAIDWPAGNLLQKHFYFRRPLSCEAATNLKRLNPFKRGIKWVSEHFFLVLMFLSIFGCFSSMLLSFVLTVKDVTHTAGSNQATEVGERRKMNIDVHIRYFYMYLWKVQLRAHVINIDILHDVSNARLSRESGRLKILFRLPNLQRSYFVLYRGSVWPRSEGRKVFKREALKTLQKCQGGQSLSATDGRLYTFRCVTPGSSRRPNVSADASTGT